MPAYFVAEVEVTNPQGYEPYRALAGASIAQYGGRFLARGGKVEMIEGGPEPTARRHHRIRRRRGGAALVQFAGVPGGAADPIGEFARSCLYRRGNLTRVVRPTIAVRITEAGGACCASRPVIQLRLRPIERGLFFRLRAYTDG